MFFFMIVLIFHDNQLLQYYYSFREQRNCEHKRPGVGHILDAPGRKIPTHHGGNPARSGDPRPGQVPSGLQGYEESCGNSVAWEEQGEHSSQAPHGQVIHAADVLPDLPLYDQIIQFSKKQGFSFIYNWCVVQQRI